MLSYGDVSIAINTEFRYLSYNCDGLWLTNCSQRIDLVERDQMVSYRILNFSNSTKICFFAVGEFSYVTGCNDTHAQWINAIISVPRGTHQNTYKDNDRLLWNTVRVKMWWCAWALLQTVISLPHYDRCHIAVTKWIPTYNSHRSTSLNEI